jgi:hypothetical protein
VLPAVPENVVATPGNAVVTIRWAASAGAATYNLERGTTSSGPYTTLATPSSPTYADSTVTNKTTYYYVVAAVNAAGQSADSAQVVATPAGPAATSTGGVSRPSYNTGTGLFVLNGKLYDSNGVQFVIQGLNRHDQPTTIQPYAAVNANANAIRTNFDLDYGVPTAAMYAADAATQAANNDVSILSLGFDPTSSIYYGGGTGNGYTATDQALQNGVAWWVSNFSTFAPYQKHLIVNIANEWGVQLSAPYTDWINQYETAIIALRKAGYTCPLLIDADSAAANYPELIAASATLFNADPQKNIIFDVHLYNSNSGSYNAESAISGDWFANLAALSASQGMVFVLGEFGPISVPGAVSSVTPSQLVNAANSAGIGWMGWAWDESGDVYQIANTPGFFTGTTATASTSSQLTSTWGQQVIPLLNTAAKATDFP